MSKTNLNPAGQQSPDGTEGQRPFSALRSRRVRVTLGITSIAATLGGGAYVLTDALAHQDGADTSATAARDSAAPAAPAPAITADDAGGSSASSRSPSAEPAPPASGKPTLPKSAKERVAAARSYAAAHGTQLLHPITPKSVPPEAAAAAENAKQTTIGSAKSGSTMRIVTARGDLTGQRELAWVAGGITKLSNVSCSQTFKFANEAQPMKKANLLVCWRTSAQRSVVVITADVNGHPSKQESAAVIDREWRSLG